jgi:hypothetical protein
MRLENSGIFAIKDKTNSYKKDDTTCTTNDRRKDY